jgi:hypothetical protein
MELASCHASDTQNFEMAPKFLENLWTPGLYNSETRLGMRFNNALIILG